MTGKYTAIPAFIGIMGIVFWLTFNVIGAWLQELMAMGVDALAGMERRPPQRSRRWGAWPSSS